MPITPHDRFYEAADHLVTIYKSRRSGKIRPDTPIPLVRVMLTATLDGFGAVSSPFSNQKPSPAMIMSDFEDKEGPIAECKDKQIHIKAPTALPQVQISIGDRVLIHVTLTIKPHAMADCSQWPIEYEPGDGTYCLGFREITYLQKL